MNETERGISRGSSNTHKWINGSPNAGQGFHVLTRPEVALCIAVLEDAFLCARDGLGQSKGLKRKHAQMEAVDWFASGRECPYSFLHICGVLGLDPQAVRRTL